MQCLALTGACRAALLSTALGTVVRARLGNRVSTRIAQPLLEHERTRTPPEGGDDHDRRRAEADHDCQSLDRIHRGHFYHSSSLNLAATCLVHGACLSLHDRAAFRTARKTGERMSARAALAAASAPP